MKQPTLARITVTLPRAMADRLARLRDGHRVSVSSIVEVAIAAYLDAGTAADPREDGASLRRRRGGGELRAAAPDVIGDD